MGWRKIVVTFASATTVGICEVPAVVLHLRAGKIIPTSGVTRVVPDEARASGTRVYLVQFAHRLSRGTCALIKAAGATVCGYIPERALVVRSDEKALATIADMPGVTWIGLYLPEYKVERALAGKSAGGGTEGRETKVNEYVVSVWAASEVGAVSEAVQRAGGVVRYVGGRGGRGWVRAMMSAEAVAQIAELAAVEWIEAYTAPHFCNDVATSARGINAAEVWEKLGLTGAGQLVGHADSGIDTGAPRSLHPDLRGRIAVAHALVRPGDWSDPLGHGTHTAGSLVGTGAAGHGGRFRGVAPGARLVHQSITDGEGNIGDIVFDFYALLAQAYEHGARIHSDSWGADVYGKYTWLARLADEFVWDTPEMLVVCAAGNNGWDANRDGVVDGMGIIAPATAKNVLSVGGAETWRAPGSGGLTSWTWYDYWPEGFPLEPLASDYVSSSADGVRRGLAAFSSRGPTADNRIKPDIVAPATDIISCRARTRGNMFGWGVYDEYYVFAGGTSMATPLAAGAAALVREWLVTRTGHVRPSAALVKALLLAGAQSLAPGQYGYGPQREIPAAVPNMAEGWGVLDLGNTLAPTNDRLALLVDHTLADTGVTNAYELVLTTAAVVRAWLVYSDYPASLAAAITLVNDLDLVVRAPSGARWYDVRTGQPNRRDNVESVRGVAPAGTCTVWVVGHQVPFAPQPYALVVRISPIPAGVLAVEDVRHEPHVVRPGVPVEVTAHVAHSLPGTLVVELCFSTNQQAWLAMPMTRRNATERGGVYAATISGMALGSAVRYFVAARAADGTRQYSATNAFCVTQGELWVALSGTATPPYDTPECGLRSLKAALEIAQAGSVVMVAPGTYYERGVRIKPFVCVRGVAGPAKTVIYAAGGGPGVVLAGQGAVLEGVTIEGAQNAGDGGGARLYAGARLLNCVVRGNRVLHYGGGVYLEYGGLVSNCSIIGNVAVYAGGGVFCQQGGVVADCVISGNRTDARFGDGGGVVLYGAGRVERSRVEQNEAGLSGGGIWLSDSAEVLNTVVAHNRARRAGGGIYANRGGVVQASRVVQNRVRGQGGGVSAGSGTRLIACELVGNRAGDGGGVRAYDAVFSACLVASNVAERGGGVFSNSGSVSNILLVANVARVGGGLWCEHAAQPQELVIMGNRARVGGGAYVSRQGVVSKSVIVHNSARAGGGVGCQNGGHVEECFIRSNIAHRGGGVWTPPGSASEAAPLITRCLIEYNAAHQAAGAWLDGRAVLRNTLLQRNRARRQAGGAYVTGQSVVENCLLTRNRADREIGGLTGTNGTVVNTIVFANLAPLAPEYDPTAQALAFSFSCTTPLPPGPGNLATDPGLLMTGAFPRPGPTSPCINAGRNAAWMAGACDFEGHPRLVGPRVDIGCHEFSAYANDRAPALLVTSPPPWSAFAFANSNVVVHGIVYDDYGTFPVTRDGRPVRMFQPPAWSDQVGLNVGTNWLVYTVRDAAGYTATATVAYILKPEYDGPVVENTTVYVARNGAHHAPFTSWATAATNLADAALAAGPGCTIVVSSGHYRLGQTVELRRPVRVRGLGHVVLDGVGARRCLTLLATGIVLEQLVISNGVAGFGAGVYARYAATLRECTITANRATVHGGGVFCERTLLLERTRLTANRAGQRGGAIFGGNDITLQQCLIDHNLALDDAGGVWGAYAPRLYRCLLWANCASNDGGGLVSVTLGDVRECVFEQNIAGQRGGGARVGDETRVLNCIFRSNQAHEGGALVAEYSRIRNVLCHDNRASAAGGGVVCGPGGTLDNGTIVFNHARYAGGVVATHGTQVRNAILYYNTPGNFTRRGRTVRVTASCVTPRTAGTGILTSPPRFLDSGANDFRLAPDSACIDAAIMLPWMARSRDLYGTPRVIGAAPDIGACEFTPEPASNQPFFALWDAFLPTDVPEPAGFALGVFFLGLCGLFLRRK